MYRKSSRVVLALAVLTAGMCTGLAWAGDDAVVAPREVRTTIGAAGELAGIDGSGTISVRVTGTTLVMEHSSAAMSCCSSPSVAVEVSGDTVRFFEQESGTLCAGRCTRDLMAAAVDLPAGEYRVEVISPLGVLAWSGTLKVLEEHYRCCTWCDGEPISLRRCEATEDPESCPLVPYPHATGAWLFTPTSPEEVCGPGKDLVLEPELWSCEEGENALDCDENPQESYWCHQVDPEEVCTLKEISQLLWSCSGGSKSQY